MGIHLDTDVIYLQNQKKENVTRKNGCIINTGNNPTTQERQRKIEENRRRYQLSADKIESIKLPKRELEQDVNLDAMKDRLKFLRERLAQYEKKLEQLTSASGNATGSKPPVRVKFTSAAPTPPTTASTTQITDFVHGKSPSSSSSSSGAQPSVSSLPKNAKPKKPAAKRSASGSLETSKIRLPARYAKPPPGSGATEESWREIMIALSPDEREQLLAQYYDVQDFEEPDDDFDEPKKRKKRKPAGASGTPSSTGSSNTTKKRATSKSLSAPPESDGMDVDHKPAVHAAGSQDVINASHESQDLVSSDAVPTEGMDVSFGDMDPVAVEAAEQDSLFDLGY